MHKRILFLPTVFFLVLAVSLWTAPAKAAQSPQLPLNPKTIPQFVDQLPSLHLIFDRSLDPNNNFKGAVAALPTLPNATYPVNSIVYLNALSGVNYPGYYQNLTETWTKMVPIELQMTEFQSPVLPANTVAGYTGTWVWGYQEPSQVGTPGLSYIGPVILATRGIPTEIKFVNNLGNANATQVTFYKYSIDQTLYWADPINSEANYCANPDPLDRNFIPIVGTNRKYPAFGTTCAQNYAGTIPAVVHLHGGEVPPVLDGGPDAWFTGTGVKGHGYYTSTVPTDVTPNNGAIYRYPNSQEAANIWFHDHALGITRLNVYAGMAGAYLINDPALTLPQGLRPYGLTGTTTDTSLTGDTPIVPLVIQDRMFDTTGQLFFPGDSAGNLLWSTNPDHPYWVPEFVGDTIVVNGKAWPFLPVEAKRYRFLFLNGSNARTYVLNIPGGPKMYVIGTDGGYLNKPVPINTLTIMPGERYDVIIDFTGLKGNFIMNNSGKTPFPRGAQPAGATLGRIIQFQVNPTLTTPNSLYNPAAGTQIRTMVRLTTGGALPTTVNKTRLLTLNEDLALPVAVPNDPVTNLPVAYPGGPLEIMVNNTKYAGSPSPTGQCRGDFTPKQVGTVWTCYSELPNEGDTEVWEIVNLTADAHPMHLHAVQFQIINRQNFDVPKYNAVYNAAFPGGLYIPGYGPPLNYDTGIPRAVGGNPDVNPFLAKTFVLPAPEEQGWKDTVVAMPGMVTRLAVRWAPTHLASNTQPVNAFFPFNPDSGHGYVWHCHIIDHEDNEMMRPTSVVVPSPDPHTRTYVKGIDY